jgi:hypothetical protein
VEVGIVQREEFNILRYEIPIVPFAGSVVEHIGLSGVVRERFMWWLSWQTSQTCKLRKKRPEHSWKFLCVVKREPREVLLPG